MRLQEILQAAVENGASDVHLAAGSRPVLRINGKLIRIGDTTLTGDETLSMAGHILGERRLTEFREKGESDVGYLFKERHNFRVNVFLQRGYVGIVMRLIPNRLPTFESLELPPIFKTLCSKRNGLVLVTGPTGSGKTTTLASMVEYMARTRNEHIITMEDPIEYIFSNGNGIVNQRQLGSDTQAFSTAIRAALREDPDIIMVGEMRDLDTISAAITAAETGHLVLSTLHTIGAAKTIDRVIDVFPAEQQDQVRLQMSNVLEAVVSQQLMINRQGTGRALALEIMTANHAIRNLIRSGKTSQIQSIIQTGHAEGMVTMDQSLVTLYKKGKIDEATVFKYCVDRNEINRQLAV